MNPPFNVVLIEPEIPPNTGNIARLCAATGAHLHLVKPLGYELSEKTLKRAGMDYWNLVTWRTWESAPEFWEATGFSNVHLFSTKARRPYHTVPFQLGDYLVFGRETQGLPESLLAEHPDKACRIPMLNPDARSLNLSTSVGVALYEALRQTGSLPEL
jgi:tRNA (cytidine/uridine-2'-O-)-methyltransferase